MVRNSLVTGLEDRVFSLVGKITKFLPKSARTYTLGALAAAMGSIGVATTNAQDLERTVHIDTSALVDKEKYGTQEGLPEHLSLFEDPNQRKAYTFVENVMRSASQKLALQTSQSTIPGVDGTPFKPNVAPLGLDQGTVANMMSSSYTDPASMTLTDPLVANVLAYRFPNLISTPGEEANYRVLVYTGNVAGDPANSGVALSVGHLDANGDGFGQYQQGGPAINGSQGMLVPGAPAEIAVLNLSTKEIRRVDGVSYTFTGLMNATHTSPANSFEEIGPLLGKAEGPVMGMIDKTGNAITLGVDHTDAGFDYQLLRGDSVTTMTNPVGSKIQGINGPATYMITDPGTGPHTFLRVNVTPRAGGSSQ